MGANECVKIPMPDAANPKPRTGDVWFNYRSMHEVSVAAIAGERITLNVHGARPNSPKVTEVSAEHMAKPRWFKFLRHEAPVVPLVNGPVAEVPETPMRRLAVQAGAALGKLGVIEEKLHTIACKIDDVGTKLDRVCDLLEKLAAAWGAK